MHVFQYEKVHAHTKYNRVLQDESSFHMTFIVNFFSEVTLWNPESYQNQRSFPILEGKY